MIADNWNHASKGKVRKAWDVNESKDKQIKKWLEIKGIPTSGGSIGVLWSRFSGKKGDIHIEHDTSYQGIRQIIAEIKDHYQAVIIAGDAGYAASKAHKFEEIAEAGGVNVFNLTGFWEKPDWRLSAWGGDTRLGQFKLYDYFKRHFTTIKHLGARSGNLEAMAMLGHTVRYLEEPGSKGAERMAAWHDAGHGRTAAGGLAMGYERIRMDAPPTRTGKYFLANRVEHEDRPDYAPGLRAADTPKPDVAAHAKGFTAADLVRIKHYMVPQIDSDDD